MMNESHSSILSKKGLKTWRWIILIVLIGVGGLILYRGWASTQKRSASQRVGRGEIPVQISPVVRKNLTYSLYITGDIAPLMQVDLFPKVSGYLEKIYVQIGDSVRQGQVIAQIDRAEFFQKVKEVEAKVAQQRPSMRSLKQGPEQRIFVRRKRQSNRPNPVSIMRSYSVRGCWLCTIGRSSRKKRRTSLRWITTLRKLSWLRLNNN